MSLLSVVSKGKLFVFNSNSDNPNIIDGVVKVVRISDFEDVVEEYSHVSHLARRNTNLMGSKWVVYKYVKGDGIGCIDIVTFKKHASEYSENKIVKVYKGNTYKIKPSEAFQGITEGVVKAVRIADYDEVMDEYPDPQILVGDNPELAESKWIVYKYLNSGELGCLDEETFLYHINN